jgi:membrane protein involved in colicin uptake
LLLRKEQLSKSNGYYHEIHPVEAEAVDKNLAGAAAAAEAKKKAAAEAAAKAAAAKAAAVATAEAKPPAGGPSLPAASS